MGKSRSLEVSYIPRRFCRRLWTCPIESSYQGFFLVLRVDDLVRKDDTIQDLPTFHVAGLVMGDNEKQDGFYPIGQDFGDDFVNDIAEGYRHEFA